MDEFNNLCNMKEKKIIFFDIDYTLYTPEVGVPKSAIEAIMQLRSNGHKAFICTGRSRSMIFPDMIDMGFDGIIAGGGTYCECDGKILFRYDMERGETKKVVEKLRQCGFIPVAEGHDYFYYEDEAKWTEEYRVLYDKYNAHISDVMRKIPADAKDICAAKVSAVFTADSMLEGVERYFSEAYIVVNHGYSLLELIPKGYSKAEGIRRIISELGIPRENTCAFGDSMNDFEMLSYVNDSVAMGNSVEGILKIAKHITDSVENDGIYNGLKKLGLI